MAAISISQLLETKNVYRWTMPVGLNTGYGEAEKFLRESAAVAVPKEYKEYRLRRFPRENDHSELSKGQRLDGKSLDHRS